MSGKLAGSCHSASWAGCRWCGRNIACLCFPALFLIGSLRRYPDSQPRNKSFVLVRWVAYSRDHSDGGEVTSLSWPSFTDAMWGRPSMKSKYSKFRQVLPTLYAVNCAPNFMRGILFYIAKEVIQRLSMYTTLFHRTKLH